MASGSANLVVAKASFVETLSQFGSDRERRIFLDWIAREINGQLPFGYGKEQNSEIEYQKITDSRNILTRVSVFVRDRCVQRSEASHQGGTCNGSVWNSEKLHYPAMFSVGGDADTGLSASNTVHLDSFLYDEADEEVMIESGELSRSYCKACGSRDTEEIVFVSHSCSKNTLEYIFRSVLPPLSAKHTVLDVGSRLGAVIYGAHLFSGAGKIVGIEINKELCDVQNQVIQAFGFGNRASVIHAEMTTRPDVFELADVVILNNVFEWFVETNIQTVMWHFLCNHIKVGAIIVTMPSLEKAIGTLTLGISIEDWVRPLNHTRPDIMDSSVEGNNVDQDVHLYQVISKPVFSNGNQTDGTC